MICKMCATGADMQSRAKELGEEPLSATLKVVGVELHTKCKGKDSCDCQHKSVEAGKNVQAQGA